MTVASPQFVSVRSGLAYLQVGAPMAAVIVIIAVAAAGVSTEPELTFASVIVLAAGAKLIWRPGEPPILFAAFFLQWLQTSVAVFRASFYGVELAELHQSHGAVRATWLSLFGLLVLAGGVRLALRGVGPRPGPYLFQRLNGTV